MSERINKKLLLTGIAALFLATGAAHADTLPKEMLGKWCPSADDSAEVITLYERGTCKGVSGSGMTVKQNAIEYWEEKCAFTSVTPRISTSIVLNSRGGRSEVHYKTFEVKAKCTGLGYQWNATTFLTYFPEGRRLEHISFTDNELPFDAQKNKVFCQEEYDKSISYYKKNEGSSCESNVSLSFEKDRYSITRDGTEVGFCRFTSIKTVWDPGLGVATKAFGGPVTYITAQCPKGKMTLKVYNSKGSMYMEEK